MYKQANLLTVHYMPEVKLHRCYRQNKLGLSNTNLNTQSLQCLLGVFLRDDLHPYPSGLINYTESMECSTRSLTSTPPLQAVWQCDYGVSYAETCSHPRLTQQLPALLHPPCRQLEQALNDPSMIPKISLRPTESIKSWHVLNSSVWLHKLLKTIAVTN